MYLVENCEHVRASIGYYELSAVYSFSRPLNIALLDLLMANGPRDAHMTRTYDLLLGHAAKQSKLPFMKALLERGVPCTQEVLTQALDNDRFDVAVYLMETYPELATTATIRQVACCGAFPYFYKLQNSHAHLSSRSMGDEIVTGENAASQYTMWEVVRSLYERCASTPLNDETVELVWHEGEENVLLFLWLVWQDPKIATSLAAIDRRHRLRLYFRLRQLVPSLFVDVPVTLPWCCQLRFLRHRVESGELTLADVERARSETAPSG